MFNAVLLRLYRSILLGLIAICCLPGVATAQQANGSLRFYGNGRDGIDRVLIPLETPGSRIDVGGDFTLEFWMKALPGENKSAGCSEGPDTWINGNILLDRDVYGSGDHGDYGVALYGGRIAFGIHNGSAGATLCSTTDLADSTWHHIALTRSAGGQQTIFVDGRLDAQADGPAGDISYRDRRSSDWPNDPYLVIGAEKHDAGSAYPSYSGWIDELRISNTIRYTAAFERATAAFAPDDTTVALYHFDEGSGELLTDSSGSNTGTIRSGGNPRGPEWSAETPWAVTLAQAPASQPSATPEPQPPTPVQATEPPVPAEETVVADTTAPWSASVIGETTHQVNDATIVKTDPLTTTNVLQVSANGFETASGDAFIFTTPPFYIPESRYTITRTNLLNGDTASTMQLSTADGRLSLRLPLGRLQIRIEPAPVEAIPTVVEQVATPEPAPPVEPTTVAVVATQAPAAPDSTQTSATAPSSPSLGWIFVLSVGLVLVCAAWVFRKGQKR